MDWMLLHKAQGLWCRFLSREGLLKTLRRNPLNCFVLVTTIQAASARGELATVAGLWKKRVWVLDKFNSWPGQLLFG